ncbi:hypothetical protein PF005_g14372 [Phytophthora fragariae]|uniref:Uncharacterized protein n=1 Tax=Phytophthora fragariae TaxID=53985 RepID=A0A6A3K0H6_9STRA|nr:hypothetical protein PF009_g15724 [Phytophthora fragariae]KAE9001046.1 hypothetical protein PF011_g13923 [Phytophthora fragariae]KAE9094033.1 hypothetical protein PF010_g17264 [Phytophthora fragariae]KAE9125723.1 hypothetical protein PF006_g16884 [Phytophthora fragariae]KAE9202994.1 hypothetical protein PF005_g14372 [Phytophthora fragariae]
MLSISFYHTVAMFLEFTKATLAVSDTTLYEAQLTTNAPPAN